MQQQHPYSYVTDCNNCQSTDTASDVVTFGSIVVIIFYLTEHSRIPLSFCLNDGVCSPYLRKILNDQVTVQKF
jgi:hypothetical protein